MAGSVTNIPTIVTPGDLGDELVAFHDHLRSANKSPNTIYAYVGAMVALGRYLMEQGRSTDVADISRKDLEGWIASILDAGYKDTTAHQRFRGAQAFFGWYEGVMDETRQEGEAEYRSPMTKMKPPMLGKPQVRVLDVDDLKRVIAVTTGRTFEERRDEALLRVFFSTGARRAEIAALRWSHDPADRDIDLANQTAHILSGKGRKERRVHLDRQTVEALRLYIRLRDKHPHRSEPWLWLGRKGRLTDSGIAQTIRDIGMRAGIPNLHPHDLRHAWRHHADVAGMSREDLMALGGWSSDAMLRRYASEEMNNRALTRARERDILPKL